MDSSDNGALLLDLETILLEERDALMTGQLTVLSDLEVRKNAVAGEISEVNQDADFEGTEEILARIRTLAERNSALMSEASGALRGTLKRVRELQKIASGADTYESDGSRRFSQNTSATLQRRA